MIWLAVLLLLGGLGYVLFHKPPLNVMGAGWQPPRLDPPGDAKLGDAMELPGGAQARAKALAAGPQPAGLLAAAPDVEDAITLRLDRDPPTTPDASDEGAENASEEVTAVGDEPDTAALAETADWSAEDAVTAPMSYPAGVVDGAAGHSAQPLA